MVDAFVAHSTLILLITCITALVFGSLEAYWKQFQFGFYGQSGEIEGLFCCASYWQGHSIVPPRGPRCAEAELFASRLEAHSRNDSTGFRAAL